MAKSQKRSSREAKKPKKTEAQRLAAATTVQQRIGLKELPKKS